MRKEFSFSKKILKWEVLVYELCKTKNVLFLVSQNYIKLKVTRNSLSFLATYGRETKYPAGNKSYNIWHIPCFAKQSSDFVVCF
jgi:hypothetical protein